MLRPLLISTLALVGLLAASTTNASAINCVQIASSARITIIPCPTPTPTPGATVTTQAQPDAAVAPVIPDPVTLSQIKPPYTGEGPAADETFRWLSLVGWVVGCIVLLAVVVGAARSKPKS